MPDPKDSKDTIAMMKLKDGGILPIVQPGGKGKWRVDTAIPAWFIALYKSETPHGLRAKWQRHLNERARQAHERAKLAPVDPALAARARGK